MNTKPCRVGASVVSMASVVGTLSGISAGGPPLVVMQVSAPGANDPRDNIVGVVTPWVSTNSAAAEYAYGAQNPASYNGTHVQLVGNRSHLFFVDCALPDGLSMFVVHDRTNSGSGGRAKTFVRVVPTSPNVRIAVRDDPSDPTPCTYQDSDWLRWFVHNWEPNNTDGFVISGLYGTWSDVVLAFVQPNVNCSLNTTSDPIVGLDEWYAYSADGTGPIRLALAQTQRVVVRPMTACEGIAWPSRVRVPCEGAAVFTASTTDDAATAYRWQRETAPGSGQFVDLADGSTAAWDGGAAGVGAVVSGSSTGVVRIAADVANGKRIGAAHARGYRCVVTEPCGTISTSVARVLECLADYNDDCEVDDFDYFDFLNAFLANSSAADFNGDTSVDDFDYFDFLNAFNAGC
ncbi:MAG: hypothetical protein JNM07_04255 [Phycisphaerae bacterium]|nr:hypothetical protein [Phycisphaerae bacterium]